jgi:hypothetical protein
VRFWGIAPLGLLGVVACSDWFAPQTLTARLDLVPVIDRTDAYAVAAAGNADRLRIRVLRADSLGQFTIAVKDTVVGIDPETGAAEASVTVALLQSPQTLRVILDAIRSSDNVVLFSGQADVQVTSAAGGTPVSSDSINIPYVGPKAARIVLSPQDTALANGASFTYGVTAYDNTNSVVNVPVNFYLLNPGDSTLLTVGKLSRTASARPSGSGLARVHALTPDSLAQDTGNVYVGAVPVGARITPGSDNVAVGGTLQLTGQIVDPIGNPVSTSVSWVSRNTGIATVNGTGLVQGIAAGTAVIVATGSGFSDSALITAVTPTHAVMSTSSLFQGSSRGFRAARVGDTVVVDVTADMRITPNEKLGSYNATLTWATATLQYIDVQTTSFAAPVVNAASVSAGTLRFSAADATGAAGQVVVARVRFRALAQGTTPATLAVTEMSAAQTFTNFSALNRVTVTSGHVTVRP